MLLSAVWLAGALLPHAGRFFTVDRLRPRRQVRKRLLAHVGQAATPPPVHEKGRCPPTEATPCVSPPPFVGRRCEGFPLRYYLYRDRLLKKGARWALHQHAPPPLPFRLGFSCLADYDHFERGRSRLFDSTVRASSLGDYNCNVSISNRVQDQWNYCILLSDLADSYDENVR